MTQEQHHSQLLCAAHCTAHKGTNTKKSFFSFVYLCLYVCLWHLYICVHVYTHNNTYSSWYFDGKVLHLQQVRKDLTSAMVQCLKLPRRITTISVLTLSRSSLRRNETGCPWRLPDWVVRGVLISACASTQITPRCGHCCAWPLTEPSAKLETATKTLLQFLLQNNYKNNGQSLSFSQPHCYLSTH